MKNKFQFILLAFLAFSMTQCKMGKPDGFDYGSVEDNTYTNTFFNMTMDIPEGWVVQSEEAMEEMSKMGEEIIAGDDNSIKAKLKVSEINTANLLAAFQDEVGTTTEFNPNFALVAENLALAPNVENGADYLKLSRQFLENSQANYIFDGEGKEILDIGGQKFYYMDLHMNYGGFTIYQRYFSTIKNDFSFNAVISYVDDEQENMLMDVIESMEFH